MAILPIENTKHLHLSDLVANTMLLDDVFVFCRQTPLAEVKYVNTIVEFTDLATAINALAPPSVTAVIATGPLASSGGTTPDISLTGIVPIANGGTNIGTIGAAGTVTYSNGIQHVSTAVGVAGQVLSSNGAGAPTWIPSPSGNDWTLTGNAGTIDGTNFLGTTDNIPLSFRVNNIRAGKINHLTSSVYLGYQSGSVIDTGSNNTGIGNNSLTNNTTGLENSTLGYFSLNANTTGIQNTAIGARALTSNLTANFNTAIGTNSLQFNTAAANTAVGYSALQNNTTGVRNTAIGYNTLNDNIIGVDITAVGYNSLAVNTGSFNTGIGSQTLQANTTGVSNTALGARCLTVNTTGNANTGIGQASLFVNTTGSNNTAIGSSSLVFNITGSNNIGIGGNTLGVISTSDNVAIGYTTLQNMTGTGNTAVGHSAGQQSTSGDYNIFIGARAGISFGIITGSNNTIIGSRITGLAPTLSNNIILADGAGTIRYQVDSTGLTTIGSAVGVGGSPNASAMLDISSTTKGLLLPRMTGAQADLIVGVDGLMVYINAATGTFASIGTWVYTAGVWIQL